jgi:hypothetical protein
MAEKREMNPGSDFPPFRKIASEIGCSVTAVAKAFSDFLPELATSSGLEDIGRKIEVLDSVEKRTRKLIGQIRTLDANDHAEIHAGLLLVDLGRFAIDVGRHSKGLKNIQRKNPRIGGHEPAADKVCRALVQIFKAEQISITSGHNDGSPSTKFGRAVEVAFAEFGLSSNWRDFAFKARRETSEGQS